MTPEVDGKRAVMLFFISKGACDHCVSLKPDIHGLKPLHLIPAAPRGSLSTGTKILQRKGVEVHLMFLNFLPQTSDTRRLAQCSVHLVLLSSNAYFAQNICLWAPERIRRGRLPPKIGYLFISSVQSCTYFLLYLHIYIFFLSGLL